MRGLRKRTDKVIGGSNCLLNIKLFRDMSEGAALGWLCGHIPPILRLSNVQDTRKLAIARLKMRAKSIKLLRDALAEHPETSPKSLAAVRLHMRTLFETECMAGDTEAAKAHSDILLRLDDPITDENVRLQHLLVMLFDATELACKKLERTVLPFGEWTKKGFAPLWKLASPFMPVAPADVSKAHSSVATLEVHEAMARLRYCLWIAETPLPYKDAQERLRGDM